MKAEPALFRQTDLALHSEVSSYTRRSSFGLPTADANRVVTAGDNRLAVFGHHAQIAVLQLEMNLLACAWIQVNTLKAAESQQGRPFHRGEFQIELHDLVSCHFSSVGDRYVHADGVDRIHHSPREAEFAVTEGCVTKAITERIQRLFFEVAVGAAFHGIVLKIWQ